MLHGLLVDVIAMFPFPVPMPLFLAPRELFLST